MPTEGLSIEQPDSQHSVDQDEEVGLLSVTRQVRFSQAIKLSLVLHALVCLLREFSLPDFVLGLHDVASEARITIACGATLKSMQSSYEVPLALAQLALHTYLLFDCNFRQLFWHQI
jgi:hypothetical protein